MKVFIIGSIAIVILLIVWILTRKQTKVIPEQSSEANPKKIILPEDQTISSEAEKGERTGETQELKRKVIHGPYRPIINLGSSSIVQNKISK